MRTQGSLRLILNTKLWPQMQVDKASEKSVRITAMDTEDQGVKVFLISVMPFCLDLCGAGVSFMTGTSERYTILQSTLITIGRSDILVGTSEMPNGDWTPVVTSRWFCSRQLDCSAVLIFLNKSIRIEFSRGSFAFHILWSD